MFVIDCAQLDCMTGVWLRLILSASNSLQCRSPLFLYLPLPVSISLSLYCWKHEQKISRNKGELWKLSKHVAVHPDTFSKSGIWICSTSLDDKHLSFTQKGLHFSELKPRTVELFLTRTDSLMQSRLCSIVARGWMWILNTALARVTVDF